MMNVLPKVFSYLKNCRMRVVARTMVTHSYQWLWGGSQVDYYHMNFMENGLGKRIVRCALNEACISPEALAWVSRGILPRGVIRYKEEVLS